MRTEYSGQGEMGRPGFFYGYVIAGLAFFLLMMFWGTFYTFGVFFKPVLNEFGWTRGVTAAAYSLNAVMLGVSTILAGRMNDKLGPRLVITVCGLFLGAGYILTSRISNLWQLYLTFSGLVGLGMGGSFVPLTSTVARWFVKRRGLMMGIVVSGIGLGTVVLPTLSERLISIYGWRNSYVIVGVAQIVLITLAAQFLKHHPGQVGQAPYGASEATADNKAAPLAGIALGAALRTGQFWLFTMTWFLFNFCLDTLIVHVVPHASDLGLSAARAAGVLAIIGGVSIAGRLGLGGVADRIGVRRALLVSFTLMSVGSVFLLLAKEPWMLYTFAVVWGVGYGGGIALVPQMVAWLFGLRAHGAIMGTGHLGATVGTVIGPSLFGFIFDITQSYRVGFMINLAFSVTAIVLSALLKPVPAGEKD